MQNNPYYCRTCSFSLLEVRIMEARTSGRVSLGRLSNRRRSLATTGTDMSNIPTSWTKRGQRTRSIHWMKSLHAMNHSVSFGKEWSLYSFSLNDDSLYRWLVPNEKNTHNSIHLFFSHEKRMSFILNISLAFTFFFKLWLSSITIVWIYHTKKMLVIILQRGIW